MNIIRVYATLRLCRISSTAEIVKRLDSKGAPAGREADVLYRKIRIMQRLVCGFQNPLRELAMSALLLGSLGHQVQLVIGYEPLPQVGGRRLFTWLESDGRAIGTEVPAHSLYQELLRFPS